MALVSEDKLLSLQKTHGIFRRAFFVCLRRPSNLYRQNRVSIVLFTVG